MSWKPNTSLNNLVARAKLNRSVREFFGRRNIMEVETPLLCSSTATDPHLHSFEVSWGEDTFYLQTSPEFSMKRLLAAGCGSIYQICKAFRQDETSPRHNGEFTLLEWYRPNWTLEQLLAEIEALVLDCGSAFGIQLQPFPRVSYEQCFQQVLGINPHQCSDQTLLDLANQHIHGNFNDLDRNGLLDLLMSHLVEPTLPETGVFVVDFPASQASLAKCSQNHDDLTVAKRAELFLNGMEIANAYQELVDAAEQESRIKQDLLVRKEKGLSVPPKPHHLIAALQNGFPECSGVAVGMDRLLLLLTQQPNLAEVISFPTDKA